MRPQIAVVILTVVFLTTAAHAQVTPNIAAQLRELGPSVCVPETAKIYKPLLLDKPPYKGITVVRNISYLPDPRTVMDVFAPEKGGGKRPVLIYIPGGNGDKLHPPPDGDAFYDNIMVRYKGNPDRIFLWAHSAGNGPASTYVGHPEIMGANADAIKGVILMSAPNFNIAPETPSAPGRGAPPAAGPNAANARAPVGICGRPAAEARGGRGPGDGARGAGAGRGAAPVDEATLLARSNLPGLAKGKTAVFLGWGEIDPPNILAFDDALKNALCKVGRCPTAVFFKDHSHMSLVFSPNTPDKSVTDPILKWMKSIK
jgi:triacylglycerol lipase